MITGFGDCPAGAGKWVNLRPFGRSGNSLRRWPGSNYKGTINPFRHNETCHPYIGYSGGASLNFLFASLDSGVWNATTVESGSVIEGVSLALDSNGNPRMAYFDNSNSELKFVEGSQTVPEPSSLAMMLCGCFAAVAGFRKRSGQ